MTVGFSQIKPLCNYIRSPENSDKHQVITQQSLILLVTVILCDSFAHCSYCQQIKYTQYSCGNLLILLIALGKLIIEWILSQYNNSV